MNINPMFKTIISSLFQKSATLPFPKEPKKTFPVTRGHVEVDMEQCILCGMCQRKCPTGAITVDRAGKTWSIAQFDCCQCSSCVDNCPKKCLRMDNNPPAPTLKQEPRTEKKTETAETAAAVNPAASAVKAPTAKTNNGNAAKANNAADKMTATKTNSAADKATAAKAVNATDKAPTAKADNSTTKNAAAKETPHA
jgi:ech hydrogenase subunit F